MAAGFGAVAAWELPPLATVLGLISLETIFEGGYIDTFEKGNMNFYYWYKYQGGQGTINELLNDRGKLRQ